MSQNSQVDLARLESDARAMSYREVLSLAEECLEKLESGSLELEDMVGYHDQGLVYLKICGEKLDAFRRRIDVQAPPAEEPSAQPGEIAVVPFAPEDEVDEEEPSDDDDNPFLEDDVPF